MVSTLTKLGMSKVRVGDTDLALFGGKVVLQGVRAENNAAPPFSLGGLDLLFSWRPLFHKTVSLAKVTLDGLAVDIRRRPDETIEINGLSLPATGSLESANAGPGAAAGNAPPARPWSISLDGLHLKNSHVDYTDQTAAIALDIDELSIDALHSAEPNQPVHIDLKARINGHPISVSGQGTPLAVHPHFDLRLTADGLDLGQLAHLVQGLDLKGLLSFDLAVTADLFPDREWRVNADAKGGVDLKDFAQRNGVSVEALKAENVDASWNGTGRLLAASGTVHAVRAAYPGYSLAAGDLTLERATADLDKNGYAAAGRLGLTGVAVKTGGTAAGFGSLSLAAQDVTVEDGRFAWQGGLSAAALSLADGETRLTQAKADWSGKIGGTLAQGRLKTMNVAGHLALDGLDYRDGDRRAQADGLTLDARSIDYGQDRIAWTGGLAARTLALAVADTRIDPAALSWSGTMTGTLDEEGAVAGLTLAGHLGGAALKLIRPGLSVADGPFAADADVALSLGDTVTVKGKLGGTVRKLAVGDGDRLDYASLGRLDLADVRLASDGAVTAGSIVLGDAKGLRMHGKTGFPWRVEAGRIGIDQAARSAKGAFDIGSVAIDALSAWLTMDKSGIVGLDALFPPDQGSPGQGSPDRNGGATQQPLHLAVGRVSVAGASQLIFEDRTMDQPVDMAVTNILASVSGIDSDRPDHDSPFRLSAAIGDATLTANGTVRPWSQKITADARAKVTAFELPQLSPYAKNTIGLNLQTGHFDGDADLGLTQGKMSGKLDITLTNMNVTEPHGPTPLAKHAGLPIKTVLGLLQDDQGRIHLTIPISGDLTDPQFDVSDAVSQTIGGVLKSTAQTTLEVLFPVAGLIDVLGGDDSGPGDGLGLDPIVFAPGSDALGADQDRRVKTVAALMKARPAVTLRLCGVASAAKDWPVMLDARKQDELGMIYSLQKAFNVEAKAGDADKGGVPPDRNALKALADKRADKIKAALSAGEGVDASRLYDCLPAVDKNDDAVPRVELGF